MGVNGGPTWEAWKERWPGLAPAARLRFLKQTADTAHRLWLGGIDLVALPLDLLAFQGAHGALAGTLPRRGARPIPSSDVVEAMAAWYAQVAGILRPREAIYFLRHFMAGESIDAQSLVHTAEEIGELACDRLTARANRLYRQFLRDRRPPFGSAPPQIGVWNPDDSVKGDALAAAIRAAEQAPDTVVIKEDFGSRVSRARLLGRDVLIKRYDILRPLDKLRYLIRPARARRAWAAARTMAALDIPTPEPLGFLEVYAGAVPVTSYVVTAFLSDAGSARKWIRPWFSHQPLAARNAIRKEVLARLLTLYRNGIYHADTKAANMLLRAPEDPVRRAFYWIDLECVEFGMHPSRRQIVRNLVQLNGSLGSKVSEADRLAFLRDMARVYPWLADPRVEKRIRAWTRRRLLKQKRNWCGS